MIRKYRYGTPFDTEALTEKIETTKGVLPYGEVSQEEGFVFTYIMDEDDIVYGLGEANRGINKRGYCYISNCTDDPVHTEDKRSLYGAHNFIVVSGKRTFGLFFDYPSKLTFDIGYDREDTLKVSCENADLDIYVLEGENAYDIVKQFRHVIGRSYIPPKFAFGFGQSRWGYTTKEDFRTVAKGYRENHIPIDMIYMDIDYMQDFKDFTVNEKNFLDFPEFVKEMKDQELRLIPIIDAGVKVEKGYEVYEEGVKNNYFCKREDGSDFVAAVWPGDTHFPDMLNPEARKWFGDKYRFLIEQGIEGFWNDMNEPAIFYSSEGLAEAKELAGEFAKDKNGALMVDRDVTVKDIDKNGILTCDEALIAAHDEYYNDGAIAGYATADGKYGKYISKFWGDESGAFGYWLNDNSCMGLSDEVKADDYSLRFVYKVQKRFLRRIM